MPARRSWFVWHSWIGLTTGLLLFVICWSGTVAVFSREIDLLLDSRTRAPAIAVPVAWEAIQRSVEASHPGWKIDQLSAPYAPGFAAEVWAADPQGIRHRIHANPATGEITGTTSYFNVQRFFRSLHMSLFVGNMPVAGIPLGYLIVGLLSLPMLASLVTSLVFYRRFWRGFFVLPFSKGARVFWSDAHKLVGLWSLWFVVVIALTGVWYLVEWKSPEGPAAPAVRASTAQMRLPIGVLVAQAQRAYPDLRITTVSLYQYENGLLEVHGQDGSWLVRDRAAKAWVDSRTGHPIAVQRPADLTAYARWIDTADPLHFGNFGGLVSKTLWFLFGIGLSGLTLTGAYLQAKRQRLRPLPGHRIAILIAYATTTAILLLASWAGYRETLTYGTGGALPALLPGQLIVLTVWSVSTIAALTVWMVKVR